MEKIVGAEFAILSDMIEEKLEEIGLEGANINVTDVSIGITSTDRVFEPAVALEFTVFANVPVGKLIKFGVNKLTK